MASKTVIRSQSQSQSQSFDTETLKLSVIPYLVQKRMHQNKLPVSQFLHDLNKYNIYSGNKLTVRKSMLLMEMSMLVVMLLPGYYSWTVA